MPETGQVGSDLLGPQFVRQQVEQHRHAAAGDGRGLWQAEHLLDPSGEDRRLAGLVKQADAAAARHFDTLGGQAVEGAVLFESQRAAQDLEQRRPTQLGEEAFAGGELR